MKKRKKQKENWCLNQRGDTIISVLIGVIVIGAISVSAYILINRSFGLNIRARERSQVTKVVQAQVEGLQSLVVSGSETDLEKIYKRDTTKTADIPGPAFCLDEYNNYYSLEPAATPDFQKCGGLEHLDGLEAAAVELQIQYYLDQDCSSAVCSPTGDEHTFVISAEWDPYGGGDGDKDKMEVYLRIHPRE